MTLKKKIKYLIADQSIEARSWRFMIIFCILLCCAVAIGADLKSPLVALVVLVISFAAFF